MWIIIENESEGLYWVESGHSWHTLSP